jgi:ribulose-5-phosphate 4-epimerase/fuculose-1-phosphate aldolase
MSAEQFAIEAATRSETSFRELSSFGQQGRERINEAGRYLQEHQALSPTLSFNAGIRVPGADRFVLGGFTPRGQQNAPAALVGFDGAYHEGKFKMSHLELLDVYATIFREQANVQAAIHTHSPYLEVFALAHRPLPIAYGEMILRRTASPIPLIPWEPRYSSGPIANAVRNNPDTPAILIANHGLFAWGERIEEVARFVVELEDAAHAIVNAEALGGTKLLPPQARDELRSGAEGTS